MKKIIIGLLFCIPAWAEFVVPLTPHPVNDYAGVINRNDEEAISKVIVDLKTATSVQIGVLVVPSLNGSTIEEASMKVAEAWKLGSKNNDGGILIMIAMAEHKSRIEIGRGLEGFLTDYQSKNILVDMRPYLRRGDVGGGLLNTVNEISAISIKNQNEIMTKPVGVYNGMSIFLLYTLMISFLLMGIAWFVYFRRKAKKKSDEYWSVNRKVPVRRNEVESQLTLQKLLNATRSTGGGIPRAPAKRKSNTSASSSRSSSTILPVIVVDDSSSYSSSSSSSSSDDSSSSSYSDSSWSGGGGDFSGGGSSDSW